MENIVNNIEEVGNQMIDGFIIPILNGVKKIAIEDNIYIKSFITIKTAFMENKISQFLKYLEYEDENDILDFINNLNSKEKIFFIEIINKTIDMDDRLQIFILSQLMKLYKNNGQLNYWEKTLFYNIKSISEDDFLNFFNLIDELDKPLEFKKDYGLLKSLNNDEMILTIKKFENLGIISTSRGFFGGELINKKDDVSNYPFSLYPFVSNLYEMIKIYKKT